MKRICITCKKEFTCVPSSKQKYCSHKCYSDNNKGSNWKGSTLRGKGSRGAYSAAKIAAGVNGKKRAATKRALESGIYNIDDIKALVENGYCETVADVAAALKYPGETRSHYKNISRLMDYMSVSFRKQGLPVCYRVMTLEQIDKFKSIVTSAKNYYEFLHVFQKEHKALGIRSACKKFINFYDYVRITKIETHALNKALEKNLTGCGSSCECKVRDVLQELNYEVKEQALLEHKTYRVNGEKIDRTSFIRPDFIVNDKLIIEVNGDYWHAWNIPDEALSDSQRGRRIADLEKYDFYKKHNYTFLVIWEHELVNIDKVKNIITEVMKNESNFERIIYK